VLTSLAEFSAVGPRDRRALHGCKLGADEAVGKVEQFLFRKLRARQRELDDRHGRGAVAQNERRRGARRQQLQHGLRDRRHLAERHVDIGVRVEEHLDHADAGERLRLDMLDIIDRGGECALEIDHDTVAHFVGRQAGIGPDDADDGYADIGEDVDRRAQYRQRAEDQQQDRQHNKRVGPL
jgi:hypothetical protein